MTARLTVLTAGPGVTVQDTGRPGWLRRGVPASGPVDRLAHATANAALGNDVDVAAVEVPPGGLACRAAGTPVVVAVAGAEATLVVAGRAVGPWYAALVRPGDEVAVEHGTTGRWAYLAVAGRLRVPTWLGSAATHALSGRGGGMVRAGDELVVDEPHANPMRTGPIPRPAVGSPDEVRVVLGPQDESFAPDVLRTFTHERFRTTSDVDRMGMRLDGPQLPARDALSMPSGPVVRGSVQVAGDGVATVLLADHQTTGGYPRIATVIGPDVDRLAQLGPGSPLSFRPVSAPDAVAAARDHAREVADHLALVASPGRTLEHRLRASNLIDGVVAPGDGRGGR